MSRTKHIIQIDFPETRRWVSLEMPEDMTAAELKTLQAELLAFARETLPGLRAKARVREYKDPSTAEREPWT